MRVLVPGALDVRTVTTCLYTLTPDRDFVVDRLPGHENIVVGLGSAHGFKFAPWFGRVLADLATTGASSTDLSAFSLTRRALTDPDAPLTWLVEPGPPAAGAGRGSRVGSSADRAARPAAQQQPLRRHADLAGRALGRPPGGLRAPDADPHLGRDREPVEQRRDPQRGGGRVLAAELARGDAVPHDLLDRRPPLPVDLLEAARISGVRRPSAHASMSRVQPGASPAGW